MEDLGKQIFPHKYSNSICQSKPTKTVVIQKPSGSQRKTLGYCASCNSVVPATSGSCLYFCTSSGTSRHHEQVASSAVQVRTCSCSLHPHSTESNPCGGPCSLVQWVVEAGGFVERPLRHAISIMPARRGRVFRKASMVPTSRSLSRTSTRMHLKTAAASVVASLRAQTENTTLSLAG